MSVVQVVCTAPGEILVNRFEGCALSAQRHPCHVDVTSLNELPPRLLSERWQALDLPGPGVHGGYIKWAGECQRSGPQHRCACGALMRVEGEVRSD